MLAQRPRSGVPERPTVPAPDVAFAVSGGGSRAGNRALASDQAWSSVRGLVAGWSVAGDRTGALAWAVSFNARAFFLAGVLSLIGCSGLEQLSSGHVGCAPDEITVSQQDTSLVGRTWTAQCRGQQHFCSTNGGGDGASAVVACTPAAGPPGGAGAVPAPPDELGCSYDTQCKGERICEEGVCTAPPEREVTPAPAPAPEPEPEPTPTEPEPEPTPTKTQAAAKPAPGASPR